MDPYRWQESVLSTRSLSYASNLDALESPRSLTMRKNTLTSISSLGEEDFHDALTQVPTAELPSSVTSSPLFKLPRDLRIHVYSYLLTADTDILWPSATQTLHLTPQVLLTCRAVYEEAAQILYTTNTLCFAHPSDANMFAHALSSRIHALCIRNLSLRIRSQDARLWTAWFNTNAPERSLKHDLTGVRRLTIRYRGPRWQPALNEKANAELWLKDPKLQEIILSVRKLVNEVKLLLCVRLPNEVREQLVDVQDDGSDDRLPQSMFRRDVSLNGCRIRVEPMGKDDDF